MSDLRLYHDPDTREVVAMAESAVGVGTVTIGGSDPLPCTTTLGIERWRVPARSYWPLALWEIEDAWGWL